MKTVVSFLLALVFIAGCGKVSEDDYMQTADEKLKNNDIAGVFTAYEGLLRDYPEGDKAPVALAHLAALYQNKMDKSLSEKASLEKSVELYRQVYEKYPKSEEAGKSLFMAGYILANDLSDYNDATETYNLFLQKFPDHQLAESAKVELDNMGRQPEDILNEKKTTGS